MPLLRRKPAGIEATSLELALVVGRGLTAGPGGSSPLATALMAAIQSATSLVLVPMKCTTSSLELSVTLKLRPTGQNRTMIHRPHRANIHLYVFSAVGAWSEPLLASHDGDSGNSS